MTLEFVVRSREWLAPPTWVRGWTAGCGRTRKKVSNDDERELEADLRDNREKTQQTVTTGETRLASKQD